MLDEPFAEIEPKYIRFIFGKIEEKRTQGISFLISDHNHRSVRNICTGLQILRSGQLYNVGNIDSELVKYGYLPQGG